MDLKRFDEISGREALERLSKGLSVFEKNGTKVSINLETNEFKFVLKNGFTQIGDGNGLPLTIIAVLESPWYVKKPFNVRAEMMAQPNEWIGAYHDHHSKWIQVGFDAVNMHAKKAYYGYTGSVEGVVTGFPTAYELETCIPIEDVPKEDFA